MKFVHLFGISLVMSGLTGCGVQDVSSVLAPQAMTRQAYQPSEQDWALYYAVYRRSNHEDVQRALDAGANIEARFYGKTALMIAAHGGRLDDLWAVEALLANGANPLAKTGDGMTAFDFARQSLNLEARTAIAQTLKAAMSKGH